jgi:ATP-dependent Lon protease
LNKVSLRFADKVIFKMIQEYTRESGVRELDRLMASMMRSYAKKVAMEEKVIPQVTATSRANTGQAPLQQ